MNNLFPGILTITFCLFGYFFSWRSFLKENYRVAVLLLVISGLAIRIFVSCDGYVHNWDERYHALVAKNLIKHPLIPTLYDKEIMPSDYKQWTGSHIWVHKQPLPLWTMAASMWLFGINEIALRLPSILLTSLGIWLMFLIGSYFFNKKVGYFAAFLYSANGLMIELVGGRVATDHIDIFFLFFVQLAVHFTIVFIYKQKTIFNILAGISIGAAVLSKWLPALIVLPVWFLLMLDSGKFSTKNFLFQGFVLISTSLIVFLPWQLYIYQTFPLEARWEASFNYRHIIEPLDGLGGPFYYFLDKIRMNYGELIYLLLPWFFWKTFKHPKDLKLMAIAIWFLIPFLFFSFVQTKMQAYILFTCPALFLMTADFFFAMNDFRLNHKQKWLPSLVLLLLIILPIRYMIERAKPFSKVNRNPNWATDLRNINKTNIQNGVLFNYQKPIEAMFYTNLTVYSSLPEIDKILELKNKGYKILINDNENIPSEYKSLTGVIIVKLRDSN